MKRLVFILCAAIISPALLSMERPSHFALPHIPFAIHAPTYNERDNQFLLCARIQNNEIGRLCYSFIPDTCIARMHYLGVLPAHRKQKVATKLFKTFIQEAKKNKKTNLVWEAMPLEAGLQLPQLVEIYKKMAHSAYPTSTLLIGQPYGPKECQKVNITMNLGALV